LNATRVLPLTAVSESLAVVIPVYNGGATLPALIERLLPVVRSFSAPYEIILVNDGSRDNSWETIQKLSARHPEITGIDLMRNYGQHNALLCGIRATRHDIIVTIDDDLQQPPEEIPRLLAKLAEGYDVVYGTPERHQHGLLRNLGSRIAKAALATATNGAVAPMVSAFRAFRRTVKPAFDDYRSPLLSIDVLLTWATTSFAAVAVRSDRRGSGGSNYRFRSLVRHAMNVMTGFSLIPLQLATLVGFSFTLFGLAVLTYVVGRYLLSGTTVAGFPFLASIIAIFSGAQLFALGILGEYLGRMHMRTMDRPAYIVRTDTAQTSDRGPNYTTA
jgi:undecaprenyl-phosphate 4-deoxy-4-formamido-L-arabinose transferase